MPGTQFDPAATYKTPEGREYKLERLEKKPSSFTRLPDNKLRYLPYFTYDIEREDDTHFYVRQYTPVPVKPVVPFNGESVTPFKLPSSNEYAWQSFDTGLPRSGQWRDGFALADVNGDGHLDIVFGPARKSFSGPAVFLGDGRGNWKRWAEARFAPFAYDYGGAAVADFDGDGKSDIAFGIHLRGLFAVSGDGTGNFTRLGSELPAAAGVQAPVFSSRKVRAFDWDGSGVAHLVALNEGLTPRQGDLIAESIVVYRLQNGLWSRVANQPNMSRAALMSSSASGKRLAWATQVNDMGQLRITERRDGRSYEHIITGLPTTAQVTALAVSEGAPGSPPQFALAWRQRDIKGWWNRIALLKQKQGNDWDVIPLLSVADTNDFRVLTFARLRQGAEPDLVSVSESGQIDVFRRTADGSFTQDASVPTPQWRFGCQGYDLQARDIDGDGIDEIVAAFAGEGTALTRATECVSGGAIQVFKLSSANG